MAVGGGISGGGRTGINPGRAISSIRRRSSRAGVPVSPDVDSAEGVRGPMILFKRPGRTGMGAMIGEATSLVRVDVPVL